jgi:hypothetical protein
MNECKRCRKTHTEEELEGFYTGWMKVYLRNGISASKAEQYAKLELQKHVGLDEPEASGPPWYVKLGVRVFGGKDMSNNLTGIWKALDGKKTIIGALFIFLGAILPPLVDFLTAIGATEIAVIVGSVIGVVGALHKVWKKYFSNGS